MQEKDRNRVRGMRIMLERQTRAAAAAASANSETAAQAAAEAQLAPAAPASTPGPESNRGGADSTASAFSGGCSSLSFLHDAAKTLTMYLSES